MARLNSRRTYDYRIREAICESGDRDLFPEPNIPRSTIRSWLHRGMPEVISCDLVARDCAELTAEIERLRGRTALLGAVVGLLIAMLRASNVQLDHERLPDGSAKKILLRALALHAQRIGKTLAAPSTWYRQVRIAGWKRPRKRVYPAKPKIGIRANASGELLHLDVTVIRLLDGTRAYLHGVIDNYSRRILSWSLEERLGRCSSSPD